MKSIKITMLLCISLLPEMVKAQYVSIPDTAFVSFLQSYYPNAMVGNQLDTTASNVLSAQSLNISYPVTNLDGIQYFISLKYLTFSNTGLNYLPINIPNSIQYLICNSLYLNSLPTLPTQLIWLDCSTNNLTSLPNLPVGLTNLYCNMNQLTNLPVLPNSLNNIDCRYNLLNNLPILPISLEEIRCSSNNISTLPLLPNKLKRLACGGNLLTTLPTLPDSLIELECTLNHINSLPTLPNKLIVLFCEYNNITNLPSMPDSLETLNCTYNPNISCIPFIFKDNLSEFSVRAGTNVSCLPKAFNINVSLDSSNLLPICTPTSGCQIAYNIIGNTHQDTSANCTDDSINNGVMLQSIKMQKWKNGSLDHQVFTNLNGYYSFDANIGDNISVNVDTIGMPFKVACPNAGVRVANITLLDSMFQHQDFGIQCNGVDLGVKSIYGTFRKNQNRILNIKAGDLSQAYNLHCGNGVAGTVTTTLSGAVSYVSPQAGALTPIVVGNTLTYTIADFGALNLENAFNIIVHTDSNASLGSPVCVQTIVNTTATDINHSNDTLQYCGVVVNSFDPNEKSVFPASTATPNSWLTYTIQFQNTGTDTAYHIFIRDTLNANLNPATFTYLAGSVEPQIDIAGNAVLFNFPHINLLDSLHNEPMSHGWVQYKIKTKANLPLNTIISNTGYIYFDNNAPVVTNTTHNVYNTLGINEYKFIDAKISPNPTNGQLLVSIKEAKGTINIVDIIGQSLKKQSLNSQTEIDISNLTNGIYFAIIKTENGLQTIKIVKE